LVRQIIRDSSFEEAFQDLYPRALRSVQRLLGDSTAAEDAAAEALARAFAEWPRVQHLPHRDAWVLRVAMNFALDTLRRKVPFVRPAPALDAEEVATLRVALWAALKSLPRRQREIVVLRYIAGLNEEEIARSLELSPGTVKTHMKRGMSALRRTMGAGETEAVLDVE